MRKLFTGTVLMFHLCLTPGADAQTFDLFSIQVQANTIGAVGGEQRNAGFATGQIVLGKTVSGAFSLVPDRCGFSVARARTILPGGISDWMVEIRPIRVEGDAVSFHVGWTRSRDNGGVLLSSGDQELTLRPGESLPLDMAPLSPAVTKLYQECQFRATSLRVSVDYLPLPLNDRRLLVTDLWLIERLPDGSERSQAISVRGQFNRPTPFYFDSLTEGGVSLEFFGEFTATSAGAATVIKLETRRRVVQGAPKAGTFYGSQMVDSMIRLSQNDVVSVELPRLIGNDAGAFANRTYSIRVRSRQIR